MKKDTSPPSEVIEIINVPEVSNLSYSCVYNYYVKNEQVVPGKAIDSLGNPLPLSKQARYVELKWDPPKLTNEDISHDDAENDAFLTYSIRKNVDKIISEDNFFNEGYFSHIFSNVSQIEHGASDLESFSRLKYNLDESVFKMSEYANTSLNSNDDAEFTEAIQQLSRFPEKFLGLKIDAAKDDNLTLSNFINDASMKCQINASIALDVFSNSHLKTVDSFFNKLKSVAISSKNKKTSKGKTAPWASASKKSESSYVPSYITGYWVIRYRIEESGLKKEKDFFIESATQTNLIDNDILYGRHYVYSVRTVSVVSVDIKEDSDIESLKLLVSSRPTSVDFVFEEKTAPPPPTNLNFSFIRSKNALMIRWEMPINRQADIVQFQVMRRDNLMQPFEIIKQYSFDKTQGVQYRTGEIVDANAIEEMSADLKWTVERTDLPITFCWDDEFIVRENVSSEYVYALASVDAHGFVSNYSTQFRVWYDHNKRETVSEVVSSEGSPRQYPNLFVKHDLFQDAIKLTGQKEIDLEIYTTPECDIISDDDKQIPLYIDSSKSIDDSLYKIQMINLDNQKLQTHTVKLTKKFLE